MRTARPWPVDAEVLLPFSLNPWLDTEDKKIKVPFYLEPRALKFSLLSLDYVR